MIRARRGTAQPGTLILSLDDFIADKTVMKMEELYPYEQELPYFHLSALLLHMPFRQLTAEWRRVTGSRTYKTQRRHQSQRLRQAGGRAKRKLCLDVDDDGDQADMSTTTGVK